MLKTFQIALLLSTILCASTCKKKTAPLLSGLPTSPAKQAWDLDNDSLADVEIYYRTYSTTENPPSSSATIGYIRPLQQHKLLFKNQISSLMLHPNDTVFAVSTAYKWYHIATELITMSNVDREWTPLNPEKATIFYVGVQLMKDTSSSIGYLKVELSKESGKVSLVDHSLTTEALKVIR